MEINEQTYNALQQYLMQTLNPATQKDGKSMFLFIAFHYNKTDTFLWNEKAVHSLSQVEVQQGFPILLLKLISDDAVDQTLRIAGAVYFKNYVKRHWVIVSQINIYISYWKNT